MKYPREEETHYTQVDIRVIRSGRVRGKGEESESYRKRKNLNFENSFI